MDEQRLRLWVRGKTSLQIAKSIFLKNPPKEQRDRIWEIWREVNDIRPDPMELAADPNYWVVEPPKQDRLL